MVINYQQLYSEVTRQLGSPFEGTQLFAHVTGLQGYDLPLRGSEAAAAGQAELLLELCRRRKQGEPLQYLLGEWEFYGLPFRVGPGVLIPRQDTETLVESALAAAETFSRPLRILDLCSGSGAVAVALACNLPDSRVTAVELSPEAFGYLEENIALNKAAVQAVQQDLYSYIPADPLDIITANPPYIPSGDLAGLQAEVHHEPESALDGGADGLDFYRGISGRYYSYLDDGGYLLLEVGAGQDGDVQQILCRDGYREVACGKDLTGVGRVVSGRR